MQESNGSVSLREQKISCLSAFLRTLGSIKETVDLSDNSLSAHKSFHPDITIKDYQKIPKIIAEGEVYQQSNTRLIYLLDKDALYRATFKRTNDRLENYFLSLFKTKD